MLLSDVGWCLLRVVMFAGCCSLCVDYCVLLSVVCRLMLADWACCLLFVV